MNNIKSFSNKSVRFAAALLILGFLVVACDFEFDLPEANSIEDKTPPSAAFSAAQSNPDDFRVVTFTNESTSSTNFNWTFLNGDTSDESDPSYTFPGEGTYSVTLMVSDALGQTDAISKEIEIIKPAVSDPVLVNGDFDKIPKNAGSDCSCSAWINKDLGEQGESSSGNGGSDNVVKLDNAEPDHVYQEFTITPNADFNLELVAQFKSLEGGGFPSSLEIRILAGSGYSDGYDPASYTEATEFPQEGWGYNTLEQVELPANNLLVQVIENPGDDGYFTYNYAFNSGDNESVALFIRGIGNAEPPEDPNDFAMYGYCSGEEEIRVDYVSIEAN